MELELRLKTTLSKVEITTLAIHLVEHEFPMDQVMDLCNHPDGTCSFRAAWLLENIYLYRPGTLLPWLSLFFDRFPSHYHPAAWRNIAKVMALLTDRRAPLEIKLAVQRQDTDLIAAASFSWLIQETVPVAVKSHCLSILANLGHRHAWIVEELPATMDFLLDRESIAFFAKVKQVRKQLQKERRN